MNLWITVPFGLLLWLVAGWLVMRFAESDRELEPTEVLLCALGWPAYVVAYALKGLAWLGYRIYGGKYPW